MAHLLNNEDGRLRLDRLIDRRHHPEVHQHFDDLGRLDRHLLGKLRDRYRLPDRHLTAHRRRGHLKAVRRIGADAHGARLQPPLLLVA